MPGKPFALAAHGATLGREIVGGATTFVALSYIVFVQPAVLAAAGMDPGAVLFATCVASAFACFVMGLLANLPVALAPAMGHNFFFAFTVCAPIAAGGFGLAWPEALAANLISGCLFLALSFLGLRKALMEAIPRSLQLAIAAGIGLLIALVGLRWAGIVVPHPSLYMQLGALSHPVTLLSLAGLLVMGALTALRIRGGLLIGMILTAAAGYLATRYLHVEPALVSPVQWGALPDVSATAGKAVTGLGSLFSRPLETVVLVLFTFLLLDVFDTVGTLIGLGQQSGLMKNGKLPRARQALFADALGTIAGTLLGTSTVTSYVESSAGIAAGARTGLAACVTGALLLLSLVAYPFVGLFGTEVLVDASQLHPALTTGQISCYPVIAPVLILIGCMMLSVVRDIDWQDLSEALPAFLTIIIMPLASSITDGIAWGFIAYAALKLLTARPRQCPPIVYATAALFIAYYIVR